MIPDRSDNPFPQEVDLSLQAACAFCEEVADVDLLSGQALFYGKFHEGFKHCAIGFDAVREWVIPKHLSGHREVLAAEKERRGDVLQQFFPGKFLRLYEGSV